MMKRKAILLALLLFSVSSIDVLAQSKTDVSGSKDYPLVSRFTGSVIEWFQNKNYDRYFVLSLKDNKISNYEVDGKITRIQYSVGKEHSIFEVSSSYKRALKKSGFEILTTLDDKNCGINLQEQLYNDEFNGLNKLPYKAKGPGDRIFSYLAAKKKIEGKNVYIVVYTADAGDNIMITFDATEVEDLEEDLITVNKINESIMSNGHIAIYDILFDTGKSDIKSESTSALKNIAEYLNSHSNMKFFIVGHTDNVGDFQSNKTLSEVRAEAVKNELVTKYKVKPEQLKAYGLANLAPISSNSSDKTRAKNRRVEIVEQ